MDRLEHTLNHAAKNKRMDSRFVYVILCVDFVKIGIAVKPESRLGNMQVGCPYELKMLAKYPSNNARHDERRLHKLLHSFHARGEWFKIPDSLIALMVKAGSVGELMGDKPLITFKQR